MTYTSPTPRPAPAAASGPTAEDKTASATQPARSPWGFLAAHMLVIAVDVSANPKALHMDETGSWVIDGTRRTCAMPEEPKPTLVCKHDETWADYRSLPGVVTATAVDQNPDAQRRDTDDRGSVAKDSTPDSDAPTTEAPGPGESTPTPAPLPWESYTLGQ